MEWTTLRWPREMQGHKFFLGKTGRIAIADWSGDTPEQTDDGVLWLDPSRPMRFYLRRGELLVTIPLVRDDGRETSTCSDVLTAEFAHRFGRMQVEIEGLELRTLARMLRTPEDSAAAPASMARAATWYRWKGLCESATETDRSV